MNDRAVDSRHADAALVRVIDTSEPFAGLPEEERKRLLTLAELRDYAQGDPILLAGAEPAFFVVLDGAVAMDGTVGEGGGELLLSAGDCFPVSALLARRAAAGSYTAREATRCAVLPAQEFHRLEVEYEGFHRFCAARVARLIEESLHLFHLQRSQGIEPLLEGVLAGVVDRTPVSCPPQTPIRTVLETMNRERIGSMVVVDAQMRPVGIFTVHDVLDRVVLPEVSLQRPIADVMSTEVCTLPAQAPVLDAVVLLAREGIRHVPLLDHGRLVGLVSESQLFSITRGGIRETRAALRAARSVDDVARAASEMRVLVSRLLEQGMTAEAVTRLVTTFNDVVAQRLVELLDDEGVFPRRQACWLVFGSEGRAEQTLVTDQDNGIVLDDAVGDAQRERIRALAERVNQALDACGYPLCKGQVMAGNPECCLPLSEWRARFAQWIDRGDPKALLNAAIFFDFRAVMGEASLATRLRDWLTEYARDHSRFLLQMAANAQNNQPPLGLVRDFVVASGGEHPGTLDLKVNGVQPFVEAARIYALSTGVRATATIERLRAAAPERRIPAAEVDGWIEAFRFIQRLRLRSNLRQARAGEPMHNHLDPDRLNDLDRRILKEAFRQARRLQVRLARDFGASAGGAFGA